jgi:hypothetical protein
MRAKWSSFVLLAISLVAACTLHVTLHSLSKYCLTFEQYCHDHGMGLDFWMMTLPLLGLLLRGGLAGVEQVRRTRSILLPMLQAPRCELPAAAADIARRLKIEQRLDLIADPAPEAFCYGLLRPRICLTSGLIEALSLAELEAVLRHERHHARRFDPLRVVCWTIISKAFWWLEEDATQAHLWRELAADRAVIAEQGRQPLASAIYKLISLSRFQDHPQKDLALSGLSVTDARIDQIISSAPTCLPLSRRLLRWIALPLLLLIVLLVCSSSMAHA